jgi:hypothetical protein
MKEIFNMCQCTPEIKTPFCGRGDCQWPEQPKKKKKIKKIYKYPTGAMIPEGAQYLSTQVEQIIEWDSRNEKARIKNDLVWHYFLVEVEEKT